MGLTHVTARVSDLAKQGEPYQAEFLVDTGSMDCMVPGELLLKAGVKPERREAYELANGESVEYDVGFARVSFLGEETVTQVIFGPAKAEPILGVVALENANIVVDPMTRTLKRLPARPLK